MRLKSKKHLKAAAAILAVLMCACTAFAVFQIPLGFIPASATNGHMYYTSDFASNADLRSAAVALNREIASEGFVLLKNDGLLPMTNPNYNVSMFGKNSGNNFLYKAFGSSEQGSRSATLYESFNGSRFTLNPTLMSFYNNTSLSGSFRFGGNPLTDGGNQGAWGSMDSHRMGLPTWETPWSSYRSTEIDSFASYNDAAFVVISRYAGEGSDMPKTSLKNWSAYDNSNKLDSARNWDDHYLQLDAYEVKMLQEVMDRFANVVIILNSTGPVEVSFLDDPTHYLFTDNNYTTNSADAEAKMQRLRAALFVGYTGTDGSYEIPRILDGTVNPSGRLVNTWMRDMKQDPTYQNQGLNGTNGGNRWGEAFVHYDEDIYVGYRYYETRGYTEGGHNDNWTWYEEQVQFPFGYGLSYTDFNWELASSVNSAGGENLDKFGTITTNVTVTNEGTRPGKEVVQLYYSTPYYAGGISKAHVVLGGFAKTDLLAPGESQTVSIELKVSDMYSYDWSDANNNGFKGYELEAGSYKIIAARNANEAARLPEEFTSVYQVASSYRYTEDTTTGAPIANLFDDVSGSGRVNDGATFKGVRRYMLRDDFEGTFPTPASAKMNGLRQGHQPYTINEEFDLNSPWYSEDMPVQAAQPGTSQTNTIKLWHLKGRDYDDPLWDAFLNQLTIGELSDQVGNAFLNRAGLASIDMPVVHDTDGPLGRRGGSTDIQWVSAPVATQTFNEELWHRQGVSFGNSALSGDHNRGGTYGPGLHFHRSPFGGRNFEYPSEDGFLGGKVGAAQSRGAITKGCYLIAKHILLNDQETDRNTIQTWASEQAIREIYGKVYEIAIKEGNLPGLMTGVNAIGDRRNAHSWALLTGLVRNEWGFKGFVITDLLRQEVNMSIRAGNDTMMIMPGEWNRPATDSASLTPTQATMIRKSAKNALYVRANFNAINGQGGDPLDMIEYGGVDTLYAVQGVDNALSVDTARLRIGGNPKMSYDVAVDSELPDGMELSEDGTLSGAPQVAGDYTFTLLADEDTDAYYPYLTGRKTFRIRIYRADQIPDTIIYEDDRLGTIPYGFYFERSIKSAVVFDAEGRLGTNVRYSLAANNYLPEGLELVDGVIRGITTAEPGSYFFTIRAEYDGRLPTELHFIVRVRGYSISFSGIELEYMQVGENVSVNIGTATSDDNLTIRYSLKDGSKLPEGLMLSSLGMIIGTPRRAYTDHEFTVVAQANLAPPQEYVFSATVFGIEMSDVTFDNLIIGKDYALQLNALLNDGGSEFIFYAVKPGSELPRGFRLLSDGTVIGSGIDFGEQSFTVLIMADGYLTVEAVVTLDLFDIFEEPPDGVDRPPVSDNPVNGNNSCGGGFINSGSGGGINGTGILLLSATGIYLTFLLGKKAKKSQKNSKP
ncbi:MAG: glycoside hydrolase family 3 C-terminal domain-containing protein [Firmicutes bacterium]|nr:glycoside hydrolase family 3 C-terminal domain-containing protein [Bacillota bacterium]